MLKRNQIMITALALMIAVAGYLNFAGTQAGQEQLASADVSDAQEDMTALLDLSEEDIASDLEDSAAIDIESLDSDSGDLLARGKVVALSYTESGPALSFFGRLFK